MEVSDSIYKYCTKRLIYLPKEDIRGGAEGLGGGGAEGDAEHPTHLHDDPLQEDDRVVNQSLISDQGQSVFFIAIVIFSMIFIFLCVSQKLRGLHDPSEWGKCL